MPAEGRTCVNHVTPSPPIPCRPGPPITHPAHHPHILQARSPLSSHMPYVVPVHAPPAKCHPHAHLPHAGWSWH